MDSYQDQLEKCLTKIEKEFSDKEPWLLLSHLIIGTKENRDYFRRTAVWISEASGVHKLATDQLGISDPEDARELHRKVHSNFSHIWIGIIPFWTT